MAVFRAILLMAITAASILFAVGYSVSNTVERVVKRESVDKAEHWGVFMASQVPDLEGLIATGRPSPEQANRIREVRRVGDIFRFKLFTAEGRLALISDDSLIAAPTGVAEDRDPEVHSVATTGVPIVDVFDGSQKPDRPDFYAEAYIPLISQDGSVAGVVEVYVDQTATRQYFMDSFKSFGLILAGLCAVIFLVPGVGFVLQRAYAEKSRKDAEFLSRFDPLTGLLNRREFVEQVGDLFEFGTIGAICYLDLDRFKTINDTYGHGTGDGYLVHVADLMRGHCGPTDIAARFGGDEFVIAFQTRTMQDAVDKVRALVKDCADEVEIEGTRIAGSVSIGLAQVQAGVTLEQALSDADAALYHAKSSGRNNFSVYGFAMGEELRKRQALETRLRDAARDQDFEVHYQPLVDGNARDVIGHEALLRLRDHDGSNIPPAVFVPLAEELGLIDGIGRWTIRTALHQMAERGGDQVLAINLSPAQFRNEDLVGIVRDALADSGFPAGLLELEITESLLLEDSPRIERQIDALKEMGVAIAMDDFGTGFSSLSYLWKYGFDRLKIDRSFVAALEESPARSKEIIETVVMLGARLDMKITAEGVETKEQSDLLSALGCDVLQGYLFGQAEPLPSDQNEADDAAAQIAHRKSA